MKELDWEVTGSSKDIQRIEPKPKNPIIKNGETRKWFTQEEEVDIFCRVSGLPHAVVKQAENFRVRELVKKIESHSSSRSTSSRLAAE